MKNADVYLYGQILITTSLLLQDGIPPRDGYGELKARYRLIGGETGVCAAVLDSLGCSVRMEGTWMGRSTRDGVFSYFQDKNVDLSLITCDETFEGLEDFVLVDGDARTCLGTFGAFQSPEGYHRWNRPDETHMAGCKVAGIDPFFGQACEDTARLCVKAGIPYVTLDCPHDSYLATHAAVNAISGEYLRDRYAGEALEKVMRQYAENAAGLTIFTAGAGELLYGRKDGAIKRRAACRVTPESTLGAGDTFKAGCVYALLKGMNDDDTVAFASACAAAAIMKFPIPLYPPTSERIAAVQAKQS
jgi:sugar/nucleoside kinase (ribokinase family)